MKPKPFAFFKTTTFRLAFVYAVSFAVFSTALLVYLFVATVGAMRAESTGRLDTEFETLTRVWNMGGALRLEQTLLERSIAAVRDFTYQFEDANGQIIVGDMYDMQLMPGDAYNVPRTVIFETERPLPDGSSFINTIEGRIVRLDDDSILLIGIKIDERIRLVKRITRVVMTVVPAGVVLALLGGYLSARYAAGRAEALSRTAEGVIAGDLSMRAPVGGSGDEFDRLAEHLNAMLDRIETLMTAMRHAGNAIAHDLRSPLSRLRNRLEVTLRGPVDKMDARKTLSETVMEVDQVLATFNAILRLAQVGDGIKGKMAVFDMGDLAGEMAELFQPACEEAGCAFETAIERPLKIRGDRALLAQATVNLLDNAFKYTPKGGRITLKTLQRDGAVLICIEDTGPGIPEKDLDRVKQRFVRLDDARTQPGSGLGLALVDAIAELHGGMLVLSARADGRGLLATLSVPRG